MKEFVTHSRNQLPVYIDHNATKVALHIQETPLLLELNRGFDNDLSRGVI